MKSDIFDIRRFWRYVVMEANIILSDYGLSLLITGASGAILFLFSGFYNLLLDGEWNSQDLPTRLTIMTLAFVTMCVSMPTKCYGKITERSHGTSYLMLPASRLEKFLSMVLYSCIVIPLTFLVLFLLLDLVVSSIFQPFDGSIVAGVIKAYRELQVTLASGIIPESLFILRQPQLYIVNVWTTLLVFLLGAIYFKSGKTAKTILMVVLFWVVMVLISIPVGRALNINWSGLFENIEDATILGGVVHNIVIAKEIADVVTISILLCAIWFRLKRLNH